VWAFSQAHPDFLYCCVFLLLLYIVGLMWSYKLFQILVKTVCGSNKKKVVQTEAGKPPATTKAELEHNKPHAE
jgi:hypothetical protein